jgi:hypothetical protein
LRRLLLVLFRWRVRLAYWRIARRVAGDLADQVHAGTAVVGILGVGPSPTCGVLRTIDLRKSVDVLGSCELHTLDPKSLNEELFAAAVVQ